MLRNMPPPWVEERRASRGRREGEKTARMTMHIRKMAMKCISVDTFQSTITAPSRAPKNPARLHKPWNRAMMLHWYSRSTPTPCVLTEIFVKLAATPKKNSPAASSQKEDAMPRYTSTAG